MYGRPSQSNDKPGWPQIWLADLDALTPTLLAIEAATPRLSPDERERAARLTSTEQSRQWTASRVALRILLEPHGGLAGRGQPFVYTAGGRPRLPSADVNFSLSDTGPFLLIAVCRAGRIGVDIEAQRQLKLSPDRAGLWIAAGQGLTYSASVDDGAFATRTLNAWTRIEAFAKAYAPTLASCLSDLGLAGRGTRVADPAQARQRAEALIDAAGLEVHDLRLPDGLMASVATERGRGQLSVAARLLDVAALAELCSGAAGVATID